MDRPVDVFISFEPEDIGWARRLADSLSAVDLNVLYNAKLLEATDTPPDAVSDLVSQAKHLIVIWSSAARKNDRINAETRAFSASVPTVKLRDPEPRIIFMDVGGGRPVVPSDVPERLVVTIPRLEGDIPPLAIPQEQWDILVRQVLAHLVPDRTRATKARNSPKHRAAPDVVSRKLSPAIPEGFKLYHSVHDILEHTKELGGAPSGALLLAAISDRGSPGSQMSWSADWLRQRLGSVNHARLLQLAKRVSDEAADGYGRVLGRAQTIAQRASSSDEISGRHLLAALLTDDRGVESSANETLWRLEQDLAATREAFYDFVRGDEDDDDEWGHFLLGAKNAPALLSGFDADAGSGDDQLDIRGDVMAFAGLIAARTLKPPLSIGLFGEWGSGKTFFMRLLMKQVAYLARQARESFAQSKTRQREQTFYRRIVQIEFNAWHYAEGNLWASLVQHIFDNLRVIDDRKRRASEELQEPVLRKLKIEKEAEVQAKRECEAAERQRKAAVEALSKAKTDFETKAKELAEISGRNVLASKPTEELLAKVKPLFAALGIHAIIERGTELRSALVEAKAVLERGQAALIPLMSSKDRGRRWLWLITSLLAGPAAALVAAVIAYSAKAPQIAELAATLSGVSAAVASITTWLRTQVTWVGDRLRQVEDSQRSFEQSIEAAQAENLANVRRAEEQLRLLEADYIAARRREDEAQRRVQEAEAKVREASIPRLLKTFIEERANSNDYRRHLGILALVRNDFERLSDLISEENEHLDGSQNDDKDRFPTAEDEARDEPTRINRIVLYIDDLDRCSPTKVVEILQAVHLLLAFPLFVVVVGVDARWVVRSLDARYRELLRTDAATDGAQKLQEFNELFGTASAHDYMEKIFQIPFWIKPMTADGSRRMIVDLLKGSVADASETDAREAARGTATDAVVPAVGQRVANTNGSPTEADARLLGMTDTSQTDAAQQQDLAPPVTPDLSPEGLSISRAELEFMSALAPLLGRSPRTLKRFVNVYRLIRVGLSAYERQLFLSAAHGLADYRSVLLLLAVDTGAPLAAKLMFETMRDLSNGILVRVDADAQKRLAPTFTNLIEQVDGRATPSATADWHRVRYWVNRQLQQEMLPDDVTRCNRWLQRVGRFSFHAGRLER